MIQKKWFGLLALFIFANCVNAVESEELLVNGTEVQVSKTQFLNALQRMDIKTQHEFLNVENRVFKAVKNYYINQVALAKAKQSGLYGTAKMQALIGKAVEDAVIREMFREYLDNALAKKKFDALAEDHYKANREMYKKQPEVDVSHILIDTKKRSKEEAKVLAEKVRERLLAKEDFVILAEQYSDDPSVIQNKGRMGFFVKEKMVKAFSDVAFSLTKIGEISPLVETQFGFHVLRLEGINNNITIPYLQIKDKLIKQLKEIEIKRTKQLFRKELLDTENTVVNKEAIRSLVIKRPIK